METLGIAVAGKISNLDALSLRWWLSHFSIPTSDHETLKKLPSTWITLFLDGNGNFFERARKLHL